MNTIIEQFKVMTLGFEAGLLDLNIPARSGGLVAVVVGFVGQNGKPLRVGINYVKPEDAMPGREMPSAQGDETIVVLNALATNNPGVA